MTNDLLVWLAGLSVTENKYQRVVMTDCLPVWHSSSDPTPEASLSIVVVVSSIGRAEGLAAMVV